MESRDIREHVFTTYANLRIGIAILAIALPFVLSIGGYIREGLSLQDSMSAYYHSGGGAMRDVFVGVLFAVGVFLYLYKGVTTLENNALNLAAIFLIGVALFPMEWGCGNSCSRISLHGIFAVLFFLSIAYVCIFRASDTLDLLPDLAQVRHYKRIYKILGFGMIISPFIAILLTFILQPLSQARSTVFFVEACGVFVFAFYWIIKTREISISGYEKLAISGLLTTRRYRPMDVLKPISVSYLDKSSPKPQAPSDALAGEV